MYHSILVGQDASEHSHQALGLAIWLAKASNAHLHLVHLHSRKPRIRPKTGLDEMRSIMEERIGECRRDGITCDCRVIEGWTTQALVTESKWHDLVIVARHGESVRERARGMGSLPNALLANSPVPVLVAADTAVTVTFDVSPKVGPYEIRVDRLLGGLTVREAPEVEPPPPIEVPIPPIVERGSGMVVGIIVGVVTAVYNPGFRFRRL